MELDLVVDWSSLTRGNAFINLSITTLDAWQEHGVGSLPQFQVFYSHQQDFSPGLLYISSIYIPINSEQILHSYWRRASIQHDAATVMLHWRDQVFSVIWMTGSKPHIVMNIMISYKGQQNAEATTKDRMEIYAKTKLTLKRSVC